MPADTKTETEARIDRVETALDCLAQIVAQGRDINRLGRIVGTHQAAAVKLLEILATIRAEHVEKAA